MRIVSSLEMKEIEQKAEDLGISRLILMENAGRAVFLEIEKIVKEKGLKNPKILLICGKGNNGGDGFVTARFLINNGYKVKIVFLGSGDDLSPESYQNYKVLPYLPLISLVDENLFINKVIVSKMQRPIYPTIDYGWCGTSQILDCAEYEDFSDEFKIEVLTSDIIIDAIFGTGLSKDITGYLEKIIDYVNKNKKFVVSIDIPSGIDSDNGRVRGIAIKADITVALGLYKLGHILGDGKEYSGRLVLGDISIPYRDRRGGQYNLLVESEIKGLLKERKIRTHKGNYGHIAILGGSKGMSGAPLLASIASIKSGCGLVSAIIPEDISYSFQNFYPEVMTYPIKSWKDEEEKIVDFINNKDVLVIGNGLGLEEKTKEFFKSFIKKIKVPIVIDADGLNILAEDIDILKNLEIPVVLTPHVGEMARLSKKDKNDIISSPHSVASIFANLYGVYLILKSYISVISEPNGRVYFSTYGNPGMATAGSGDVLAGIIGSFIGQGYNIIDALSLAVVVHGLAGDVAKKYVGENSLTAGDIIKNISKILKKWEEK